MVRAEDEQDLYRTGARNSGSEGSGGSRRRGRTGRIRRGGHGSALHEKCYVISSAPLLGVRETRHFAGEYRLTEEDILQARLFDDWIVTRAHFNFDVHNLTGAGLDSTGAQKEFKPRNKYTIPYGCFAPKRIDGLLLAGRNISGTHMAHSSFRVMPICVNMGQGVGTAAALCVRQGVQPRTWM